MDNQLRIEGLIVQNDKTVSIRANPHMYDYIHRIDLDFNNKKFELVDGGGQMITGNIFGNFEWKDGILTLHYKYDNNVYTGENKHINITKKITVSITDEEKYHFDGYCKEKSTQTITFSESPFILDEVTLRRSGTLFNMLNENPYPLTFYNDFYSVPCDVQYERFISDEKSLKQLYYEKIDKDSNVLSPFDEDVRRFLMNKNVPHKWFIIKFDKEHHELIAINYCDNNYCLINKDGIIVKRIDIDEYMIFNEIIEFITFALELLN